MLTFELPRECFYIPCFFTSMTQHSVQAEQNSMSQHSVRLSLSKPLRPEFIEASKPV